MRQPLHVLSLVLPVVLLSWASRAEAACTGDGQTWSCTAGSTATEVESAVSSAADGATITFEAGAYTWDDAVDLSADRGVTLACASEGACDVTVAYGSAIWLNGTLSGDNDKLYRISGFTFRDAAPSSLVLWFWGPGTLSRVRIDHNTFQDFGEATIAVAFGENSTVGAYYGVLDHNTATGPENIFLVHVFGGQNEVPPQSPKGTIENMFVEDNVVAFTNITNAGVGCADSWGGASVVWRHNQTSNCLVSSHGVLHAGGPWSWEVYGNSFHADQGGFEDCYRCFHHQGSGELIAFDNVFDAPGGKSGAAISMTHYRSAPASEAGYGDPPGRCDGTQSIDGNDDASGYPCWRQPGRDGLGNLQPMYVWNNRWSDSDQVDMLVENPWNATNPSVDDHIAPDRDYYNAVSAAAQTSPTSPFDGTTGMGFGTLANRPPSCNTNPNEEGGGVGYFAIDDGPQGTLYRCSAQNTWTVQYVPFVYPHPLVGGGTGGEGGGGASATSGAGGGESGSVGAGAGAAGTGASSSGSDSSADADDGGCACGLAGARATRVPGWLGVCVAAMGLVVLRARRRERTSHALALLAMLLLAACSGDDSGASEGSTSGNGGHGADCTDCGPGGSGGSSSTSSGSGGALGSGIIPEGRRIDWQRVGVPGGIPDRTTLCTTIDAATFGDGATDATAEINAAIQACPEEQVVYLPPGTYRLADAIDFQGKSSVTLRGAGPGKTILRPESYAAITSGQAGLSEARPIVSGSTKGSTSITVSDATGIEPGSMLDLFQANDPDFYWSRGNSTDRTGQFVMVTAVDGTTLTLEDPLVWDFTLDPRFKYHTSPIMRWSGIENFTISADESYGGSMIQFWNTYASWIRHVETAWGNGNEHIFMYGCLRNEIRDSYIHDTHSTTDGYGIVTMKSSDDRGGCTGMLVENNIFSGFFHSMILEAEVGSAIAYNYSRNARYSGWPDYQVADFNANHGEHGMMILFEGNVAAGFINDGYHGSTSHITLFRNWFSGQHTDENRTGNIKTTDLTRFSYYHNVVGNVLGSPSWPADIGQYEMTGQPGYTEQAVIYRLGYPNMGNNGYSETNPPDNADDGGLDPKVVQTILRHGNYDHETQSAVWDEAITDQEIPVSLYRADKPPWWGDASWPAIGPDRSPMTGTIPAEACYQSIDSGGFQPDVCYGNGPPAP